MSFSWSDFPTKADEDEGSPPRGGDNKEPSLRVNSRKNFFILRGDFFGKSNDQRMPFRDATALPPFPPRIILPQRSPGDRRDKHAGSGKESRE